MGGERDGTRRTLSSQERTCLDLLAAGRTEEEVARALDLSLVTVLSYLASVYRKLGTQSRTHAVAVAIREGIIHLGDDRAEPGSRDARRQPDVDPPT